MTQKTFPLIGKYYWGWSITLVLVIIFAFGLVTGLTDSIRWLTPDWLIPLGIVSVLSGWISAGAKKKPGLVLFVGIFLGSGILTLFQSGASQNFYQATILILEHQITYIYPHSLPHNTATVFSFLFAALENLTLYCLDIYQWFHNLLTGRSGGINQLGINLVWGSLLWIALFLLGWLIRRKNHAFLAGLPGLLLISSVIGYTRQRTSGLIIALTALLSLMILIEHLKRENQWDDLQIDYSEELRFDIISAAVPTIIIIIAIAGFIPRISLENLRASLINQQGQREPALISDFSEQLGLEPSPIDPIRQSTHSGMPRQHLIGSGPELQETIIMEIDIGEIYLPPQVEPLKQPPKYYWFGSAYEIYIGTGWIIDALRIESISANQSILTELAPFYRPKVLQIRKMEAASGTLYFPGILHSVDQPITAAWHDPSNEYFSATVEPPVYQVNTYIFDIAEDDLLQSQELSPGNILENYLQLPPELPERVIQLANEITNPGQTPYEKAQAIETYLRQFEYSLDLPLPPEDRDIVDYFLFDLQKGYCDYYASAMVIIARSVNLPARFVVGYTTGTYDYAKQVYIISEANAHAWPEIFIEPYGWIPFEPTASLSVHNWTIDESLTQVDFPQDPGEEHAASSQPLWYELLGAGILLAVIFLAGYLLYFFSRPRSKQSSTTLQIQVIFQNLQKLLNRCFFPPTSESTPRELVLVYSKHLTDSHPAGFSQKLSSRIIDHISNIVDLYEVGVYSPRNLPDEQVKLAQHYLTLAIIHAYSIKMVQCFRKN